MIKFIDLYNQDKNLHKSILNDIKKLFKKTDFILGSEVYEFEKNFLDKGIMTLRFKINYWLLKKLGLNGYTLLVAIMVAIVVIIIYEFILN